MVNELIKKLEMRWGYGLIKVVLLYVHVNNLNQDLCMPFHISHQSLCSSFAGYQVLYWVTLYSTVHAVVNNL